MAKLAITVGEKTVTVDTEQPAQSQQVYSAAFKEHVDGIKEEIKTKQIDPLKKRFDAQHDFLVDEVIRLMRASSDTGVSSQVDSEDKVTAEREFLLTLDNDRLFAVYKRYAGTATVAKPQTKETDPETPETDPEAKPTEFAAKITPPKRLNVQSMVAGVLAFLLLSLMMVATVQAYAPEAAYAPGIVISQAGTIAPQAKPMSEDGIGFGFLAVGLLFVVGFMTELRSFIGDCDTRAFTNNTGGDLAKGAYHVENDYWGFVLEDTPDTEKGVLVGETDSQGALLAKAAVAVDEGEYAYWDTGNNVATNVNAGSFQRIGWFLDPAAAGVATCRVKLQQNLGVAAA